ncbi:sterol regulatory element-binding protein sre1 [Sporothrix brasiliensis 5110]|uniref:Sterol regulatory element-binding protein sre1 n=1 Tax=Sporothrix brasiliensis 5110 TaxID=1398154 RepID=A0A0C2JB20_9PEZI|nr:sterol regulatory element-binding protein sre1 [Sporothrix brasiliensis 5110]KIH94072.1 sterol regulatory element-binding protein sre1 [Sporothrix brasiliensis 5110]
MHVCQPMSSVPSSSAIACPMKMKMQLQNREEQQTPLQRRQNQKLQQKQRQQQLQLQLQQQQQQQQQHAQESFSVSPDSLYSYSFDEYTNFANNSYGTDFSADSPLSPGSPVSPPTANPFAPSVAPDDFDSWNKTESDDPDGFSFKPEPGNSPLLFASTVASLGRDLVASAAIDPLQLSHDTVADDFALSVPEEQLPQDDNDDDDDDDADNEQQVSGCPSASTSDTAMSPATVPARGHRSAVRKPSTASRSSTSATASSHLKRKHSRATSAQSRSPRQSPSPSATHRQTTSTQRPKKTAHNLIEKRYRTNLNDKIVALRDAVPSLRVVARRRRNDSTCGSDDEDNDNNNDNNSTLAAVDGRDLGSLAPAHKLNKATILSKATEYIAHLERRNDALARENTALRGKVDGFEALMTSRGGQNGVWC